MALLQLPAADRPGEFTVCSLHPDNKSLYAFFIPIQDQAELQIWNLDQGKISNAVGDRASSINPAVFSPNGSLYVVYRSGVTFVDTKSFNIVAEIEGPTIQAVRFSPDGKMLLAADGLGNLHRFDVPQLTRP